MACAFLWASYASSRGGNNRAFEARQLVVASVSLSLTSTHQQQMADVASTRSQRNDAHGAFATIARLGILRGVVATRRGMARVCGEEAHLVGRRRDEGGARVCSIVEE